MADSASIILKPGREKSLLRRHPWVFSGAVSRVDGDPQLGQTVDVLSDKGQFLARGAYSPASQIRARVWTYDPAEKVDADLFRRRIQAALALREGLAPAQKGGTQGGTDALRLVHAESDGLPGLIVDRYANHLVLQFLSTGAEFWRETTVELLAELTGVTNIYERSDADVRELEGLQPRTGILREQPPDRLTITENGIKFTVDIAGGHKTGFYLDQRHNRQRLRELASGRDVLDCFSYTGGFTLNALEGGAKSVLSVDSSVDALNLLRENISINGLPADRSATMEGDVFQLLRKFRDEARSFDLIVLDPPKFAPTAVQAEKAARGYKDINLLAFKLLRRGESCLLFPAPAE